MSNENNITQEGQQAIDKIYNILEELFFFSIEEVAELKSEKIVENIYKLGKIYNKEYLQTLSQSEVDNIVGYFRGQKFIAGFLRLASVATSIDKIYTASKDSGEAVSKAVMQISVTILALAGVKTLAAGTLAFGYLLAVNLFTTMLSEYAVDIAWEPAKRFIYRNIESIVNTIFDENTGVKEPESETIKRLMNKFYELSTYKNFNYDSVKANLIDKESGFVLSITDGVTNYIIDDNNNCSITGTDGKDIIYLGNGFNVVNTLGGNDIVYGGSGDGIYFDLCA